ncbi:MAG TPA: radical SAM protein [bacterium]|nr:radical SAM protein [bacterium]
MSGPARFLGRFIEPAGLPLQLIVFVTGRCNCRCGHCFYGREVERAAPGPTLEEFGKIARSSGPLLWLSLTGGEPFLREDLPEITRLFVAHAGLRNLTLPTNGLATDRILESTERILRLHPRLQVVVYLSLDGPREVHDALRGVDGCFDRALETWRGLKELKKRHRRLNLAPVTTICGSNSALLGEFFDWLLAELEPDDVVLNMLRGTTPDRWEGFFDPQDYVAFQEKKDRALVEGRLPHFTLNRLGLLAAKERYQWRLILSILEERRQVIPCLGGTLSAVVSETGYLYPCETLMGSPEDDPLQREHFCRHSAAAIGNLAEADWNLRKLWWSKRAEEIRRHVARGHCWCTYECAWTTSILFNPRCYPDLLRLMRGKAES